MYMCMFVRFNLEAHTSAGVKRKDWDCAVHFFWIQVQFPLCPPFVYLSLSRPWHRGTWSNTFISSCHMMIVPLTHPSPFRLSTFLTHLPWSFLPSRPRSVHANCIMKSRPPCTGQGERTLRRWLYQSRSRFYGQRHAPLLLPVIAVGVAAATIAVVDPACICENTMMQSQLAIGMTWM